MNDLNKQYENEYGLGMIYAILAYSSWGILPLYWKLVDEVPATEILMHRIFWSFFFLIFLLVVTKRWKRFIRESHKLLTNKASIFAIIAAAALISLNWFVYIWSVNSGQTIEASLGYYINPLISVLLGIVVLKEKLAFWQGAAFIIAAIGVIIQTVEFGSMPWIAFALAFSFAFYGLVKKVAKLGPLVSLTIETMLVLPVALFYLGSLQISGQAAFANGSWMVTLVLLGAGVITAFPLLWFAEGAARIPLYMIGFFQYIGPTIQLVIAIFVFKETFTMTHFVSFCFIWVALLLFSFAKTKAMVHLQSKLWKRKSYHMS